MRVWGKAQPERKPAAGVARAALEGSARPALVREAALTLLAGSRADRVGVWLESTECSGAENREAIAFRGMVAEKEGDTTPAEWSRLSTEAPLPPELLAGLKAVEQELGEGPERPVIGAVTEMRRVLWVPVEVRGHLRGVIFAGQRSKHAHLPRGLFEAVAADLALAMDLEGERRLGRERHGDIGVVRSVLAALVGLSSPAEILTAIVEDCTAKGVHQSGLDAVFAGIGRISDLGEGVAVPRDERSAAEQMNQKWAEATPRFSWRSGDAAWIRALESQPLCAVWQRALESRRVAGSEPGTAWAHGDVARVVAFPLEAKEESLGVLVAGIRRGSASLAAMERMELRAALAASALLREKHNEEAREQQRREKALLAASGAATVALDSEGRITELSTGAQELLEEKGKTPGEVSSKFPAKFARLFSYADAPRVQAWLQRAAHESRASSEVLREAELRNGRRVRLQVLPPNKDGATAVLVEPLADRGTPAETQRGMAELLNVIEWLEEGVVLFGAQQEIRAMNSRFAQIVGLTPEEMSRITTLDGLIASLSSRAADPGSFSERWLRLARSKEGATRDEWQLARPVPRLLERAARPILDETGALVGRVEIYRDLTAQRVFQSKLLQTEKLAELGQMLTGMAHELSNPLTSILGYAQRLLLRHDAAGHSHEARQIFQEAERASAILRQLLLSARESHTERRRVALNQVVSRAVELQSFGLASEKVRMELDLEPVLPFVQGDPGQLQQVLMNLIGNARQALEEQGSGGTIRVATRRIAEQRVLLEVADDGPGIPEAIQARIFDPFFTTKPPGVGTGLGLSIVRGIVREHGGQVHLKNAPGGGAVFSVELPALAALEMPLPAAEGSRAGRAKLERPLSPEPWEPARSGAVLEPWAGLSVLVLEDEPTVARLIADVLEDEGMRVDMLLDSRKALQRAARQNYALVVCDMKMPEVDGEHFYQALVLAGNPLCERFLFVTGDVLAAHTRDFLERHHLPHVAKPFRVEELAEKIRSVLEKTSPLGSSSAPAAKSNAARTR